MVAGKGKGAKGSTAALSSQHSSNFEAGMVESEAGASPPKAQAQRSRIASLPSIGDGGDWCCWPTDSRMG